MPTATCPACRSDVPYSKTAKKGSTVTCPECEETFTPPKLVKKGYDPTKDEDTYKVGRATSDQDEEDKGRKAAAAMRAGRRRERELNEMSRPKRGWTSGPEIWLLIFAVGAGGGLPFGLWLARSWDKLGNAKMFLIIVVMIAAMMAAAGLGGSAWAWLRKNR